MTESFYYNNLDEYDFVHTPEQKQRHDDVKNTIVFVVDREQQRTDCCPDEITGGCAGCHCDCEDQCGGYTCPIGQHEAAISSDSEHEDLHIQKLKQKTIYKSERRLVFLGVIRSFGGASRQRLIPKPQDVSSAYKACVFFDGWDQITKKLAAETADQHDGDQACPDTAHERQTFFEAVLSGGGQQQHVVGSGTEGSCAGICCQRKKDRYLHNRDSFELDVFISVAYFACRGKKYLSYERFYEQII